jgi:predicted RNA-binding Zn ribbon-like protein
MKQAARDAGASRHQEFVALRGALRELLHAALEGKRLPTTELQVVNDAALLAPVSPQALVSCAGQLVAESRYATTDPTEVALASIAADAIRLLTGPDADELRACHAPGCVLMFVRDHPRRAWCCESCGNRARQARHYERTRQGGR